MRYFSTAGISYLEGVYTEEQDRMLDESEKNIPRNVRELLEHRLRFARE